MAASYHYNVVFGRPHPKNPDKRVWREIGKAFVGDKGNITLHIDAIPLNFTGELHLFKVETRGKGGAIPPDAPWGEGGGPSGGDDVPF